MTIEAKQWDAKVAKATGWCHFMQSAEWAEAQKSTAWQSELTEVKMGQGTYPAAIYSRSALALGAVYQLPKLATLTSGQAAGFTKVLKQLAGDGLVIKMDIDQPYDEKVHTALLKQGWLRVRSSQYEETVLVDLGKGREELLKSFKKRARWELNAGLRRGVKVEKLPVNAKNMELVYGLLKDTHDRAHFISRSRAYTEKYWQLFEASGQGSMYVAKLEGKVLAAAYIIHIGERAYYKDGASIRVKPDVFASRVMQWQIIQDLMDDGYTVYDLCGVSTEANTELSGVSLFKTGFGEPVRLQWGYELPLSAAKYKLWKKFMERVAIKHSLAVRKEVWY